MEHCQLRLVYEMHGRSVILPPGILVYSCFHIVAQACIQSFLRVEARDIRTVGSKWSLARAINPRGGVLGSSHFTAATNGP